MKIVAAYLLAVLGGNTHPSVEDINAILGSVGIEVEDERIELLLSQVKGRDLAEVIASGREKMASISSVGSAIPVAAGGGGAASAAVAAEPVKEDKKEDEEESEDEMCFSLFD
ncbi:60S acidic ribosomal protein P2-2-like [Cucurbita pepo subsp. pepo]|uniref:60S acidic ribosomal protein P2-2-like n=1 Tax=Cucurbita pepo subsp. pepo TaxID=3664 RepID=UPI000C9D6192|nr:60S acidic ribosomal protein P2-2-like [Cucurbita pepo subsp. pepo]